VHRRIRQDIRHSLLLNTKAKRQRTKSTKQQTHPANRENNPPSFLIFSLLDVLLIFVFQHTHQRIASPSNNKAKTQSKK
jgi:hypothetical protein